MSRLSRPLNHSAVSAADDEFYQRHPEFIQEDGTRVPLDDNDPAQANLREEWRELYLANGGELEEPEPDDDNEVDQTSESCPSHEEEEVVEPTITARWSKESVTPDHNSTYPPATPPTDTIPDEAQVECIVETTIVPDGTSATIEIRHCHTDSIVHNGTFRNLEVQGNRVIDVDTNQPLVWVFRADHQPWDPWDKPFYYFKVTVDYQDLEEETEKDFESNETDCLRVIYWHCCVAESSSLAGVLPECNTVQGILNGVAGSKAAVQDITNINEPLNRYGSLLRNTYVFHEASHGNVQNRSTGASISSVTSSQPPDDVANPSEWRSVVSITPTRFGDTEIANDASVPSVPRYLFYSSTCLTGWESSFADALIKRGTRNIIAFRRTIPDSEAPVLARKFYNCWAGTYNLNPEKIPDCFFKEAADHYDNMHPVLFGQGGGKIEEEEGLSAGAIAAIAIAAVVVGVLVGVAVWSALRDD